MNDPGLNQLLQWGIQNSDGSVKPTDTSNVDPALRDHLFGIFAGPSQADLMYEKMNIIKDERRSLKDKIQAFEAFDDLIAQVDNTNYLENKLDATKLEKEELKSLREASSSIASLWTLLLEELQHTDAERRSNAAMCTGTAVENNARGQAKLLTLGGIPTLVKLATEDQDKTVRKHAVGALSRASRNFQPGLDIVLDNLPPRYKTSEKLDAGDMDAMDSLMNQLRTDAARAQ